MNSHLPIGMFDSGLGGLTVLRALQKLLPNESVIYLGDTARLPYGDKSPETICRYSIENTIFLLEQNIKLLVVACNTAASAALPALQKLFNVPILSVIEPGALAATQITKNGRIAVLGTKGTIASGAYQKAIKRHLPDAHIQPIPCPLLVPLIEEGLLDHPATHLLLKDYLLQVQDADTLLLGCTHYPLLRDLIIQKASPSISIIDSAITCASEIEKLLEKERIKNSTHSPSHRFYVSDNPEKFQRLGAAFLGTPISTVYSKTL